ncbi:MAG: hypothetical protein Q4B15_04140 [Lachnospiraceae bacterium]|nr:hypothetical protein [Lachnospiraceae bacterium]
MADEIKEIEENTAERLQDDPAEERTAADAFEELPDNREADTETEPEIEEEEGPSETKMWIWTLAGLYCFYNVYRLIQGFGDIASAKERYAMIGAIILFAAAGAYLVISFGPKVWKMRGEREKLNREAQKKERERRKAERQRHMNYDNSASAEEENETSSEA